MKNPTVETIITLSDTCNFPLCKSKEERHGYCISHAKYFAGPKVKKLPIGVNKVSDKRKVEQKQYVQIVKEMIDEDPLCSIKEDGCQILATGLHHQKKRSPATFLDQNFLIRACDNCNSFCELFPLEAIAKGYSISKFKK